MVGSLADGAVPGCWRALVSSKVCRHRRALLMPTVTVLGKTAADTDGEATVYGFLPVRAEFSRSHQRKHRGCRHAPTASPEGRQQRLFACSWGRRDSHIIISPVACFFPSRDRESAPTTKNAFGWSKHMFTNASRPSASEAATRVRQDDDREHKSKDPPHPMQPV